MLKPRYENFSEMVSGFGKIMEGMDKVQPSEELMHREVKAARKRLREEAKAAPLMEHVEHPTTPTRATDLVGHMRELAGLVERPLMPRDPGVLGTTRFNEGYDQMVKPTWDSVDEEDDAHEKKMKTVAKKVHQAAASIDKEYDEYEESVQVEGGTKAADKVLGGKDHGRWMGNLDTRTKSASKLLKRSLRAGSDSPAEADKLRSKLRKMRRQRAESAEYQEGGGSRASKNDRQLSHAANSDRPMSMHPMWARAARTNKGVRAELKKIHRRNDARTVDKLAAKSKGSNVQEGGGSRASKASRQIAGLKKPERNMFFRKDLDLPSKSPRHQDIKYILRGAGTASQKRGEKLDRQKSIDQDHYSKLAGKALNPETPAKEKRLAYAKLTRHTNKDSK